MRKELCTLGIKTAADILEKLKAEGTETVQYKRGVWNPYYTVGIDDAKQRVLGSPYGADITDEDGTIYVSCPCSADMW